MIKRSTAIYPYHSVGNGNFYISNMEAPNTIGAEGVGVGKYAASCGKALSQNTVYA